MNMEEFLLRIYCWVDDEIKALNPGRLRPRGFAPKLRDSEVITLEIAGEYLGRDKDTDIFSFFRHYHRREFPALAQVDRTTFVRQAANLWQVKQRLWQRLVSRLTELDWLWLVDSLPLPVCQLARAPWCRRFECSATYGYDHVSRQTFYGFRVHLRAAANGLLAQLDLAPANVSDLAMTPTLVQAPVDIGDRNYWSPDTARELALQGITLLAPFRSAKNDPTPDSSYWLGRIRRIVETAIGQMAERYHIKRTWARDLWHLCHRLIRKFLSHTMAVWLNAQLGRPLLQLAGLVTE
jgi:hypothetical protein